MSKNTLVSLAVRLLRASLPFAALLWCVGCGSSLTNLYTPKELAKTLAKDGGWRMLVIPDSKFLVGSEVTVKKDDGLRWVGYLKECEVPPKVLEPVPGSSPAVDWSKDTAFSASAALNLQGIKVGPEYDKVTKVTLHLVDYGADALDVQRVNLYLSKPENKLPVVCEQFLNGTDNYLSYQAFRVTKGRYTLYDKDTKKITLTNDTVGRYLGELSAGLTVTGDGSLEFTQPMVIAVRLSSYADGQFVVLGAPATGAVPSNRLDEIWSSIIERYPDR